VLSSEAISSPFDETQHVRNSQCPGSIHLGSTRTRKYSRMSATSDSTMGIGLNGGSDKKFLFTLLTEQADILFAEEAVGLSVEQVLTFFLKDSPQDDL